ncbi:MAG: ExbD/TolR family protein [Phycisphaerales bacterium JB039]
MNFGRRTRRRTAGVDLTPMIDVTLQLIIFFMYTAQFSQVSRTPIDLPEQPGESDALDPSALVVDVDASGQFLVEQAPLTLDALMARLEAEIRAAGPGGVDLLVRADRNSSAANINQLAERLAASGVRSWKLGTIERRR